MEVVFIGGVYTPEVEKYIGSKVKSNGLQVAADNLQKAYLEGLEENKFIDNITLINLPFIGSYPSYFNQPLFYLKSKKEYSKNSKISIFNYNFLNIKGIKNISRFYKSFVALIKHAKENSKVVCYSMHLPFLLSIYIYKLLINRKINFYVIIPDLPEYMTKRYGLKDFFYRLISKISYYIVNRSSGVAIITERMHKKFNSLLPYTVIEGIISNNLNYQQTEIAYSCLKDEKYFLYTGTLASRYGVIDLISAFITADVSPYKLVICGDGEDRVLVEELANQHSNIIYLGHVDKAQVIELQKNASILVNPRSNNGEYTAYSFPSKIIEYMSSGTPVMMYHLEGIPKEYEGLFYEIKSYNDMVEKIRTISFLDNDQLLKMGKNAKYFIERRANPKNQVSKLVSLMQGISL